MHFSHRLSHKDQGSLGLAGAGTLIHKAENVHFGATVSGKEWYFHFRQTPESVPVLVTGC